jgi:hypothetical protein
MKKIDPEHIVLAQTPMRTLLEYHDKHVLICGQGATEDIGRLYARESIDSFPLLNQWFVCLFIFKTWFSKYNNN